MLIGLARRTVLKMSVTANEAKVGYSGVAARIARIHQEGMLDKVAPGGPLYRYPARRLLGATADDRAQALDTVIDHLSGE